MESKSYKLMIPGPVEVSEEVLCAMGSQVQPHYGPDWTAFYNETLTLLKKVFNTTGDVFLMVGSGTVAIDACVGSSLSTGEKIIIGNNGFFGDRLVSVAKAYGLNVVEVKSEWGKRLEPIDFERALRQNPEAKAVAVVHLETSTTVLNRIEEIGPIVRAHGGIFIVDAVSSLGGVPFEMDRWCIDFCASAVQKCLGAPPGLGPVAINSRGWEAVDRNPQKNHGWYSDLRTWRKYATEWGDWHPSPITMATSNVVALHVALEQLMQEGIETRLARYRALAIRLRAGLQHLEYRLFTPDEEMTPVLTAAYCPEGVSSAKIVAYLSDQYQIKISGGLGDLKEKMFRVGTMSPLVSEADIDNLLLALERFKN
jgi:alanine-glyoxylate transaminase/serine-glyoxylate transaminase/serine-pyruvate transaminase